MRVIIYVEGPSDKVAMENLLQPLIARKAEEGIAIEFFEAPQGDKKARLLTAVPVRAVNILSNDPDAIVAIMPDLYPPNKGFPHQTFNELTEGIMSRFAYAMEAKGINDDRLVTRFKVFCFKYDLEALLLAGESALREHLGNKRFLVEWKTPVEEQNHNRPPKRVIEDLFKRHNQRYHETTDAPLILGKCQYQLLAEACPQSFKPFVEFLSSISPDA